MVAIATILANQNANYVKLEEIAHSRTVHLLAQVASLVWKDKLVVMLALRVPSASQEHLVVYHALQGISVMTHHWSHSLVP